MGAKRKMQKSDVSKIEKVLKRAAEGMDPNKVIPGCVSDDVIEDYTEGMPIKEKDKSHIFLCGRCYYRLNQAQIARAERQYIERKIRAEERRMRNRRKK